MKKVEWKVVEVGGKEWKFLVTSYRAPDRDALNNHFRECERRNEPYLTIKRRSMARTLIEIDFISCDFRLKKEVVDTLGEVVRKWILLSMERHRSVEYSGGWGRTYTYLWVDPTLLDNALKEVSQIVLDTRNWEPIELRATEGPSPSSR